MSRVQLLALVLAVAAAGAPAGALGGPAGSTADGYVITVAPDHPDGFYKAGEQVRFAVHVTHNGEAVTEGRGEYAVEINGAVKGEAGTAALGPGGAIVNAGLDGPGCLILTATFKTDRQAGVKAEAGAAVEPSGIRPALPAPEDFDRFWAEQKKKLAAVPMVPELTPTPRFQTDWGPRVETFELQIECPGWRPLSGYFARPKGAKAGSLPAILWLHGAGFRSSYRLRPAESASKGMLALDINAHGLPNGKPSDYYAKMAGTELKGYTVKGIESPETFYFLGMYLRMARAIEFLCAQPEWDGRTLIACGSSQGGGQALVAAGLDERVSVVGANVPAFCDLTAYVAGRRPGWPMCHNLKTMERVRTLSYFDACNFSARSQAKTVLRVGLIDRTCPPVGVLAAYNQLKGKKHLIVEPAMGHTYVEPDKLPVLSQFIAETAGEKGQ
jgi:cephalosporin-C deacetylase-like acetyl esterase